MKHHNICSCVLWCPEQKHILKNLLTEYCCLVYVFIVPSYGPGEAAFSKYGMGTLTSCLLAFFLHSPLPIPSLPLTLHIYWSSPDSFTSYVNPWPYKKTTPTKAGTVKKCRFHGGLEIWIYSGKWLNSPRNISETRHEILYSSVREGRETGYSSTKPSRAVDQSTLEPLLDESQRSYPKIS